MSVFPRLHCSSSSSFQMCWCIEHYCIVFPHFRLSLHLFIYIVVLRFTGHSLHRLITYCISEPELYLTHFTVDFSEVFAECCTFMFCLVLLSLLEFLTVCLHTLQVFCGGFRAQRAADRRASQEEELQWSGGGSVQGGEGTRGCASGPDRERTRRVQQSQGKNNVVVLVWSSSLLTPGVFPGSERAFGVRLFRIIIANN